MAEIKVNWPVLLRRDTAANWAAKNPTLRAGEVGIETDTTFFKVGDGTTAWTSLKYVTAKAAQTDANGLTIDSSYLKLTGGTVTGNVTASSFQTGTAAANYFQCQKFRGQGNADTYYHAIDFGYAGHNVVDFHEYGGYGIFIKTPAARATQAPWSAASSPRDGMGLSSVTLPATSQATPRRRRSWPQREPCRRIWHRRQPHPLTARRISRLV